MKETAKITNLYQSFANADAATRQALAKQFEPLVNRITKQQQLILKAPWNTLKSMAYEGLVIAMNTYDPERSGMSFTQFAGFAILNNIRNSSCIELHTVKLTSYTQDQIKKNAQAAEDGSDAEFVGVGATTFTSVSINSVLPNSDNDNMNREMRYGVYESAKFGDGDPMMLLKVMVDDNCNKTDAYCFYSYFGVCGYEERQVMELAEEFSVTPGRISQRIKKVTDYIKKTPILCESLASLLER